MKRVSIFEGKNKFSELVANAARGEPRVKAREKPLTEILLDDPARKYGIELTSERDQDPGRPTLDLSE